MPIPSTTRETISSAKVGASAPMTPAAQTVSAPATNTRRGPTRSASRPIDGWPTALARYIAEMSQAVSAAPT